MSLYEVVKQPCIEAVSLHVFYSLDHQPSAIPLQERCLVQLEARDLHPAGRTLSLTLVEQSYRISTFPPNLCSVLDQELCEGRDYLTFLFSDDTWVRFLGGQVETVRSSRGNISRDMEAKRKRQEGVTQVGSDFFWSFCLLP